jgi:hypothetical protein
MADSSHRVAIAVAVIGVMGTLGAALIANWDKIFPRAPQAPVTPARPASEPVQPRRQAEPAPPPPQPARHADAAPRPLGTPAQPVRANTTPQIAGVWRDADNPNNGTKIDQHGNQLQFTRAGILSDGVRFESAGTGALLESRITLRYVARYQTGSTSTGECSGSVSPGATRITLNCADSLHGTFVTVANRV